MTSTPTRPVDNVVITTKSLQDRNINILDGTTVENKGILILIARYLFKVLKKKVSCFGRECRCSEVSGFSFQAFTSHVEYNI